MGQSVRAKLSFSKSYGGGIPIYASEAQMAERWPPDPVIAGSSPAGRAYKKVMNHFNHYYCYSCRKVEKAVLRKFFSAPALPELLKATFVSQETEILCCSCCGSTMVEESGLMPFDMFREGLRKISI